MIGTLDYLKEISKELLNVYWVRTEAAMHRILDANELNKIHFKKPLLDLGCGNGLFSFTYFGGKFDSSFDVYQWVNNTKGFLKGKDIYDQSSSFKPKIIKKPKIRIDYGIDWKQNLLNNAKMLDIYDNLVQHDLNYPLPFENEQFSTIFSNDMFWIEKIEQLLHECNRILKNDGKMILLLPDKKFKENLIHNVYLKDKKQLWAKILDRGNYPNMKQCHTYLDWKSIFGKAGFKIDYHKSYMSDEFMKFSQIAMKQFSGTIIKMLSRLKPFDRKKIKNEFLQEITPIVVSYLNNYEKNVKKNHQFHIFVLKKK